MTIARIEDVAALAQAFGSDQADQDQAIAGLMQREQLSPGAFGAVGDGIADDTAAVQAWADAGGGILPAGRYRLTAPILLQDKSLYVRGGGFERSIFVVEGGVGFSITRSNLPGISPVADFDGVAFLPKGAATATAIRLEEVRPTTGVQVCGGFDFLRLNNVSFQAAATDYWKQALHTINAGGVVGSNVTFGSDAARPGQSDPNSRLIRIENTQANVNVIRALQLVNVYARRAYKLVEISAVNGVESIYIAVGEFVGSKRAIEFNGPGFVGAIMIAGMHFDVTGETLWSADETAVSLIRLIGSDFRKGNNGGALEAGPLVRFAKGESLVISGNQFSGTATRTPPGPAHAGVVIEGSFTRAVVDGANTFRNMDVALALRGTANSVTVGPFHAASVTTRVENTSTLPTNEINSPMIDFGGDLGALAGSARGTTVARVLAGAAPLPTGAAAAGSIVTTRVFDSNAAYQEYADFNTGGRFIRQKKSGVWGQWLRVSALPATGPQDLSNTGTPEGVVAAPVGSTFRRTDGGAGSTLYVKESGTGNTGWVAK